MQIMMLILAAVVCGEPGALGWLLLTHLPAVGYHMLACPPVAWHACMLMHYVCPNSLPLTSLHLLPQASCMDLVVTSGLPAATLRWVGLGAIVVRVLLCALHRCPHACRLPVKHTPLPAADGFPRPGRAQRCHRAVCLRLLCPPHMVAGAGARREAPLVLPRIHRHQPVWWVQPPGLFVLRSSGYHHV